MFINGIVEAGAKVTLIPRPRRFGKTLNLSMLKYFFEKTDASKRHLFDRLAISNHPDIMAHQGEYPVIFMTLKDIKQDTWQACYDDLKGVIGNEYERHNYLLSSSALSTAQKRTFQAIIDGNASTAVYRRSLKDLAQYLQVHHQKKVVILIDEYDTVIHEAYLNKFYAQAISFMRAFLGGGLKDNSTLALAVITGILRVAKESIFSGLNNLEVCTLFDERYADAFGFFEADVHSLLSTYSLAHHMDAVRTWYNGYGSGNFRVYNPWSIVQFIRQAGIFKPYWVNTSQNDLIKFLIRSSGTTFKKDFESLLDHKPLVVNLEENIVFSALKQRAAALWTFLVASGYLTFTRWWQEGKTTLTELVIPNIEVYALYETIIDEWFADIVDFGEYQTMLQELAAGNIQEFQEHFIALVPPMISSFDVSGKEPEKFYHALVLGMLVSLEKTHEIKSNRESGFGRYDVIIIPKNASKPGIIIEFKKVSQLKKESLATAAHAALEQIADRDYAAELRTRGIRKVIELAIVFDGKRVLVQEGAYKSRDVLEPCRTVKK
jgi:hypothetical protein